MNPPSDSTRIFVTPAQRRFASWMADVLVYVVVLNLFVEFVNAVVIDSFAISILTAVLLKLLLDLIFRFEHLVSGFFKRRSGAVFRILELVAAWAILFLSKFLLLEIVDIVFGDEVELGGLLDIIALVIALMATRQLFQLFYERLGERTA